MPGRAPAQAEEAAAVERPMRDMLAGAADRLSLHMPGAQGRGPFGPLDPYRLETTELAATDDLYAPGGAIARAEALAARCAGAARTLMLTGGSTAGVQAMLLYAAGGGGAVILPRNAHLSALHLCAVAGLEAVFARPSFTASGLCYTTDESYLEALERRRTRGRCWRSGRTITARCAGRRARRRGRGRWASPCCATRRTART